MWISVHHFVLSLCRVNHFWFSFYSLFSQYLFPRRNFFRVKLNCLHLFFWRSHLLRRNIEIYRLFFLIPRQAVFSLRRCWGNLLDSGLPLFDSHLLFALFQDGVWCLIWRLHGYSATLDLCLFSDPECAVPAQNRPCGLIQRSDWTLIHLYSVYRFCSTHWRDVPRLFHAHLFHRLGYYRRSLTLHLNR